MGVVPFDGGTKHKEPDRLPPLVAAIAKFAHAGAEGVPADFIEVWRHIPAMVESLTRGTGGDRNSINVYTLTNAFEERAIEESRHAPKGFERNLARGIDLLNAEDPDLFYSVRAPASEAAFNIGLALGIYIAMNGASVNETAKVLKIDDEDGR
jgi:hypothetical protein